MDGYLKIKTKLDNKDVDKGIVELEDKIKKMQLDNVNLSKQQDDLQAIINKYNELSQKTEEYKKQMQSLQYIDTKGHIQVTDENKMLNLQAMYSVANRELEKQASKIDKVYTKLNKVKTKQTENNAKIEQYKQKIEQINLNKVQQGIENVGKGIQNSIGKIAQMSMAILGIRTAWGAVKSAISMVSQYNSQVSVDLEYMRYCIANMLLPFVQWLVKLLYTALSYINAISKAWFGVNLFSKSSAKNFENAQKSTSKMKKDLQTTSFDEMNVLQNNTSEGNSNNSIPSSDLSNMQGEVPKWLQWVIDNKDVILSVIAGIATGITSFKLLDLFSNLGLIENKLLGIKALGIGGMISGIIYIIQSLIAYLNDQSWENFGKIIQGVGVTIVGLAALIGSVPLAVAGAIVLIIGTIVKYWEQIKNVFQDGINWLADKSDWVHNMFGDNIGGIYDLFVENLQYLLNFFDSIFTMIKGIFDGFIMFIKGVFTGDWKMAWEGIKKIFISIFEGIKGIFFSIWDSIKSVVATVGQTVGNIISNTFKAVVNGVLWAIENILNKPIRTINSLIGVINAVPGINLGYLKTFSLPRLAKGGVISQPTQAIIGEAGKEAVVPLENNLEWLDKLSEKISSKIGGNSTVNVYLDSRLIQRQINKRNKEIAFATNI